MVKNAIFLKCSVFTEKIALKICAIDSLLLKTGVFAKKRSDLYKKITFSFDILYMYYYGVCKILIFWIARKMDSKSSNCFFKSCSWGHNLLIYNSFFSISLSTYFFYMFNMPWRALPERGKDPYLEGSGPTRSDFLNSFELRPSSPNQVEGRPSG